MEELFGFLGMAGAYKDRLISNTKINSATIDTVAVIDSDEPYETAVKHPSYNQDEWVIVEMYDSRELAKKGHEKWVNIFSKKNLPKELADVSTALIKKFLLPFLEN